MQLIPLYSEQEPQTASASSSSQGVSADNELLLPQSLMRFPPLAYLANSATTSLNFLRECPLLSAKAEVLQCLLVFVGDISEFVGSKAKEVRSSGAKYFGDGHLRDLGSRASRGGSAEGPDAIKHMDCLYAQHLAFDLVPYLLLCHEAIFSSAVSKVVERVRAYNLKYSTRFLSPLDAPHLVTTASQGSELLGKGIFAKISKVCWCALEKEGLMPKIATPAVSQRSVLNVEDREDGTEESEL